MKKSHVASVQPSAVFQLPQFRPPLAGSPAVSIDGDLVVMVFVDSAEGFFRVLTLNRVTGELTDRLEVIYAATRQSMSVGRAPVAAVLANAEGELATIGS